MDRHRQSNKMSVPPVQHKLPGMSAIPRGIPLDFTLDDVRKLKNESHAIVFSVRCSGYDPKEIPSLLDIDQGQWSCIKDGKKFFPHDRRNEFMDLVGNEALLMYGVESRGYDFSSLRKHQSDTEQRLAAAEARVRELEHRDALKDEWIAKVMGSRR